MELLYFVAIFHQVQSTPTTVVDIIMKTIGGQSFCEGIERPKKFTSDYIFTICAFFGYGTQYDVPNMTLNDTPKYIHLAAQNTLNVS